MNTKAKQVKDHLLNNGHITSWDAIQLYRATRLSDIIFRLRKEGYLIESEWQVGTDINGNKVRYVKYNLITEKEYVEKNMNHIPQID